MKDLRRLIPFFRPYRRQVIAGLLLVVVSTAITSVIPWLLRAGIDAMSKGADQSADANAPAVAGTNDG